LVKAVVERRVVSFQAFRSNVCVCVWMSRRAFRDMLGSAKGIFEQALKERENKAVELKVRRAPSALALLHTAS